MATKLHTMRAIFTATVISALIATSPATAQAKPVTVFAAASLTEALQEIGDLWMKARGIEVRFSFGASSLIARQIEEGAPADIFCSADEEWMDRLVARNVVVAASRRSPIGNRLVLIAPGEPGNSRDAAPQIDGSFDLAVRLAGERLAIAEPEGVPAGRYAAEALRNLGLWDGVAKRLAPGRDVRATLALVERGEAPLGIVYATDAAASTKVRTVGVFPESSHTPISYPMARVAGKEHERAGVIDFFDFLAGEQAREVFVRRGFLAIGAK